MDTTAALIRPEVVGPRLAHILDDDGWRDLSGTLVSGGKSNLTFELFGGARPLVLRRPPTGTLLPSAHDMAREARIQRALAASPVPVADIVLLDADGEDLGVPYYVMGRVDGVVVRNALPGGFASTDVEKTAMADVMADVLADLHAVDPDAVGLGDLAKREGYLERQLRRWLGQSERASESVRTPQLLTLHDELAASLPAERPASIIHGDYRMDNVMFAPDEPGTIRAVLDWELSTLGDPLADLALALLYWGDPEWPAIPLIPDLTRGAGWPGSEHVTARYSARTGTDVDSLDWYLAFSTFKFAAIAQGVATRAEAGDMAGQTFGELGGHIRDLVDFGRSFL